MPPPVNIYWSLLFAIHRITHRRVIQIIHTRFVIWKAKVTWFWFNFISQLNSNLNWKRTTYLLEQITLNSNGWGQWDNGVDAAPFDKLNRWIQTAIDVVYVEKLTPNDVIKKAGSLSSHSGESIFHWFVNMTSLWNDLASYTTSNSLTDAFLFT